MEQEHQQKDLLLVDNQQCPVCGKEQATFSEYETEDPHMGPMAIFAIKCAACGYKTSDLEFINERDPAEYSVEITSKEDLKIKIIKSGGCEISIPSFRISVDSTMGGEGFITNVEGLLERFKKQVLFLKEDDELEPEQKTRIKTILKGIEDVVAGERQISIKLKDDTGNSAIVAETEGKVVVKKIRRK